MYPLRIEYAVHVRSLCYNSVQNENTYYYLGGHDDKWNMLFVIKILILIKEAREIEQQLQLHMKTKVYHICNFLPHWPEKNWISEENWISEISHAV